jgi:hypothetical protein
MKELRQKSAMTSHVITTREHVDEFIEQIKTFLNQIERAQRHPSSRHFGKPVNFIVSLVTGEDKFGPLVDLDWAAAALPCTPEYLRWLLKVCKPQLDVAVYRRVQTTPGRRHRVRLLSLHDLRVLRGRMLVKGRGKDILRERGEIE